MVIFYYPVKIRKTEAGWYGSAVHLCKTRLFILPKKCISLKANLCVRKTFVAFVSVCKQMNYIQVSLGAFDRLLLIWYWWWQHRGCKVHNTSKHAFYTSCAKALEILVFECTWLHSTENSRWFQAIGKMHRVSSYHHIIRFPISTYYWFPHIIILLVSPYHHIVGFPISSFYWFPHINILLGGNNIDHINHPLCRREIHVRVRDENEFPPEWPDDQYNVEVINDY